MKLKANAIVCLFMLAWLSTQTMLGQASFNLREIARTGDNASVPQQLSTVSNFSFNSLGQTAFIGDQGLFLRSNGRNAILVGTGDPAPGGGSFVDVTSASMNSIGQIVFRGDALSPSTSGLFLYSNGHIAQLVADNSMATSGDVILPINPSNNDLGTVVFSSFLNGLFVFSNGVVSKLAGPGDPAPGGGTFSSFTSQVINHTGQIAFVGRLSSGKQGVFLATPGGQISKIIERGDIFPDGSIFSGVTGNLSINDAGDVAFAGGTNGLVSDAGIFLYSGGNLNVVLPEFTPIPSLGGIQLLPQFVSINNAGQIAFTSQIIGVTSESGVFVFAGGNATQIMTPGQSSPDGDIFTGAFSVQINNSGQVGFLARELQHNDGLFLSANGATSRLAGQGDTVARQPKLESPFAFGLSNREEALVFDNTFPGGIGLFSVTPSGGPHHVVLDAHVGESIGNDGVMDDIIENFAINGQGQVLFNTDFSSGISSLVRKSGNTLTELVRASFTGIGGDAAPSGGTFIGLAISSINNLGQVAFSGFDTIQSGIYVVSNGQISLAIDPNTPIPNGSDTFEALSLNSINDKGEIAFMALPFFDPFQMLVLSNGQFTPIVRDGDPAPGGGTYALFFDDTRYGPVINNNSDVAFATDLLEGGRAIFLFSKGTTTRIAGPGDPSPDGGIFLVADAPTMNNSGQIAFSAETTVGLGAFAYINGTVVKVAAPGDRVGPNDVLTTMDLPQINDLGEIAFGAGLSSGPGVVYLAKPKQQDDSLAVAAVQAAKPLSIPNSRAAMKSKHPRNFAVTQSFHSKKK